MRKRNRCRKQAAVVLMALSLAVSENGVVTAATETENAGSQAAVTETADQQTADQRAADQQIMRISTAEEFAEFGRKCASEIYSKGKTVILEADIDLSGIYFQPIPVFAGIFDGNGHSITGLDIRSSGSNLGLFRYVEEDAVIRNLRVSGEVMPDGSRINIGGIAGTNRGLIKNCTFDGSIMGQEALGGIAGCNEETGVIQNCTNHGVMTGNLKTGGIVGYNEGTVSGCMNRGEINTSSEGVIEPENEKSAVSAQGIRENIQSEKVNDAGGIAGFSKGTISGCRNFAAVGRPHTGYNMGGIAGRHCGVITDCLNYGKVNARKDAGGIAGQFEPHLTVIYQEDLYQKLNDQLDELSDMGKSLSRVLDDMTDKTSNNLDQADGRLERVKEIGRFYKDLYKDGGNEFDRDVSQSTEEIQEILEHMNLKLVSNSSKRKITALQKLVEEAKALGNEMKSGYEGDLTDFEGLKEWLEIRYGQVLQMKEYSGSIAAGVKELAETMPAEAVEEVEEFKDDLEDLQVEASVLMDVVDIHKDRLKTDLENMDEEMSVELDYLSGDMDAISDDLKSGKDQIRSEKNNIEDQIEKMRDTISDSVEEAKDKDSLFEDVSDVDFDSDTGESFGIIAGCRNEGLIEADYQAGGIAGIIGMEVSVDPEQDLDSDQEKTLNVTRNARAIVVSCINQADITVKNDYAGGIVGKAKLGALIQNQNYGDIASEDGDYVGGITGSSDYVLRQNYSMCEVSGQNYAGGIAGWGKDVRENYALVTMCSEDGEWLGSVAGDCDPDGTVENNFYVDNGLGAVDGVTYESQAAGCGYEEFMELPSVPVRFSQMAVRFLVDDQVVKTIYCEYGSAVDESEIPEIPVKDGYYYQWEEKDLSCIKGNEKIRAVYNPWNVTLASSDDKKALLLAEANFYPESQLSVTETLEIGFPVPEGYEPLHVYDYQITQAEDVPVPEQVVLHVRVEEDVRNVEAALVDGENLTMTDARIDGEYLVFNGPAEGRLVIMKKKQPWTVLVLCGFGILAAVAAMLHRRGKRGRFFR